MATTEPASAAASPSRPRGILVILLAVAILVTLGTGAFVAVNVTGPGQPETAEATVEALYDALADNDCERAVSMVDPALVGGAVCPDMDRLREEWGTLDRVVSTEVVSTKAEVVVERTAGGVADQRIVSVGRQDWGWIVSGRAACHPPEEPADGGNEHLEEGEPLPEYSSNPPTSGPHSPDATSAGIYEEPPPVEELLQAMEHGTVIVWTNELSKDLQHQVVGHVTDLFNEGYDSLIITEYPDMDYRLAMTAWGHLQGCVGVDEEALVSFVESFYASGPEGFIACFGTASDLPPCRDRG
ncbi:MAG: DUF3105 domain-containing protein [Actinomycetota bacterium]|nr:DUF3105 domain-containing protein [Actinomycetota bacterium]